MTVAELISRLADYPPDATVYVSVVARDPDDTNGRLTSIEIQSAGAMVVLAHDGDEDPA